MVADSENNVQTRRHLKRQEKNREGWSFFFMSPPLYPYSLVLVLLMECVYCSCFLRHVVVPPPLFFFFQSCEQGLRRRTDRTKNWSSEAWRRRFQGINSWARYVLIVTTSNIYIYIYMDGVILSTPSGYFLNLVVFLDQDGPRSWHWWCMLSSLERSSRNISWDKRALWIMTVQTLVSRDNQFWKIAPGSAITLSVR